MQEKNTIRRHPASYERLDHFKVAAVQMVSGPDVLDNLSEARRLIGMAASKGARLIVLPEYFAIMGSNDAAMLAVREHPGEGVIQHF